MANPLPSAGPAFSEREFYLAEFRGRSIGIAWPADETPEAEPLAEVIEALVSNGSRVVVLTPQAPVFEIAGVESPVEFADPHFAPQLWRRLREHGRGGVETSVDGFPEQCLSAALALRLAKVVWIRRAAPVERAGGEGRVSVVDLAHLAMLVAGTRAPLFAEGRDEVESRIRPGCEPMLDAITKMIEGGIPAVNVCAAKDLARELFTYAGAGTFFTRDRYAEVRPLAIDDYDLANDLIERGEADGFLAPRGPDAREAVLAHGVGVFIEGRYLAGIGAILPHPESSAAELASLFALTRYVGEGAGGQIVRYAIDQARASGLDYLFSCTTSGRVETFFERHGFRRVTPEEVPPGKWDDYAPARRARVRCLRIDLRE